MSSVAICMKNKVSTLERLIKVIYRNLVVELGVGMGKRTVGRIGGSRSILHSDCSMRVFGFSLTF